MSSETLHEDAAKIGPAVIDRHRAVASLMEELEAIDWYDQRVAATDDPELKEILAHNRDEEKEHASMVLEWLRRHDETLSAHLKTYLNSAGNIIQVEVAATAAEAGAAASGGGAGEGSLGIGSLRQAG
jgi:uncharacterized protein